MKNLSSKLFGGLAVVALLVGSLSMTSAKAETVVCLDDVQIEATNELNSADFVDVWIICDNFVFSCTPQEQF